MLDRRQIRSSVTFVPSWQIDRLFWSSSLSKLLEFFGAALGSENKLIDRLG